jgi:cell wall-associated NlpC family hydrolase
MKWLLIFALVLGPIISAGAAEDSVGDAIKKLLRPSPTPGRKHARSAAKKPPLSPSPTVSPEKKKSLSTPSPSPASKSKRKRESKRKRASPTSGPEETPSPAPTGTPEASASKGAATLSPDEIAGYDKYPPRVRQILDTGLELTRQNLAYMYGSSDPANGGMDCSGFIFFVLQRNGFSDVPRDSSQQYVWVRKAGNFNAVLSNREDSFEFDGLQPGDLLFWRGTYHIDRDPPVTHTMIYLGREKRTKKRVMLGASDGRTYNGRQIFGVSVFDFKLPAPSNSGDVKISPVFVGYGRIPGLSRN